MTLLLLALLSLGPEPPCVRHIIDYRLVKIHEQIPISGSALWMDNGTIRKTTCDSFKEWHSQNDIEVDERADHDKIRRTELLTTPTRRRAEMRE